jgi:hypothetical protein
MRTTHQSGTVGAFALAGSFVAASLVAAAPVNAAPVSGATAVIARSADQSLVQKVEFLRKPDGSVVYKRPDFSGSGPFLFYYRGYAYPYYPGYTYRKERGELLPQDVPHRVKVRQ